MTMLITPPKSVIARRFNAVLSKRAGLVLAVTGEAGIGKSFQVAQALREIPCRSASVHSTSSEQQLFQALPKVKRLPVWTERQLEKLVAGEFVSTEVVVNTLVAMLATLAPFVLHLEDAHEASPDRLEMIEKLGQAASHSKGVGLIVTSRNQTPKGFARLRLEALGQSESEALLEQELGAKLPPEALKYLFDRAQGNPLFTLEFLRFVTRQGFLWSDGENWNWRVPPEDVVPFTIEALIEQMISGLIDAEVVRAVLEARAMIPSQVAAPFEMWSRLTDVTPETLRSIVESLEHDGLLRQSDFAHPLIREVLLQSLSPSRRRELARRVLDELEATNFELAARFVRDAELSPQEAYAVLQKAVTHAQQIMDTRLEGHWLVQAVEYAPTEERASLAIRAAEIMKRFDVSEAIRVASIALNLEPKNEKAVFTLVKLKGTQGERLEMEQLVMTLPEAARASEYGLKQHLIARANSDDTPGAFELWQQLQSRGYVPDAEIINQVIQTVYLHGDSELASQLAKRAFNELELPAAQRAMLLIDYSARSCFELGDYNKAEGHISKAVELLRTQADPRVLALAIGNRGIVRGSLNRLLEAIEDFKEAARLFADIGLTLKYAESLKNLGTGYGDLGRFSEAEMVLLEARDILRHSQLTKDIASCEGSLAHLYANWMPPYGRSLTLKHARAALEAARSIQNPALSTNYLHTASLAEAGHGDAKKALDLAQELMAISEKLDNPRISKQAHHAYGIALDANGNHQQAVAELQKALQIEHESGSTELIDTLELEIDRITNNLASVRVKMERFKRDGEGMLLILAERYFPELTQHPDYSKPTETPISEIQLLVLGEPMLQQHDQIIKYRGRKRLEFLLYLLETRVSGRQEAHTLEMIDAFYPELSEAEAKAALKQLVYLVRHQFGSEIIQSTPNGYALGAVSSDIEAFLATGEARLWRGTYLQGFGEGWLQSVRDAVVHALQSRVEVLAETDPKEAVRLGKIFLEMEPFDLDALELTLQALVASNEHPKRLYLEMRQKFLEVGDQCLPETAQEFLEHREVSIARV